MAEPLSDAYLLAELSRVKGELAAERARRMDS
jgi:hypothetical protein